MPPPIARTPPPSSAPTPANSRLASGPHAYGIANPSKTVAASPPADSQAPTVAAPTWKLPTRWTMTQALVPVARGRAPALPRTDGELLQWLGQGKVEAAGTMPPLRDIFSAIAGRLGMGTLDTVEIPMSAIQPLTQFYLQVVLRNADPRLLKRWALELPRQVDNKQGIYGKTISCSPRLAFLEWFAEKAPLKSLLASAAILHGDGKMLYPHIRSFWSENIFSKALATPNLSDEDRTSLKACFLDWLKEQSKPFFLTHARHDQSFAETLGGMRRLVSRVATPDELEAIDSEVIRLLRLNSKDGSRILFVYGKNLSHLDSEDMKAFLTKLRRDFPDLEQVGSYAVAVRSLEQDQTWKDHLSTELRKLEGNDRAEQKTFDFILEEYRKMHRKSDRPNKTSGGVELTETKHADSRRHAGQPSKARVLFEELGKILAQKSTSPTLRQQVRSLLLRTLSTLPPGSGLVKDIFQKFALDALLQDPDKPWLQASLWPLVTSGESAVQPDSWATTLMGLFPDERHWDLAQSLLGHASPRAQAVGVQLANMTLDERCIPALLRVYLQTPNLLLKGKAGYVLTTIAYFGDPKTKADLRRQLPGKLEVTWENGKQWLLGCLTPRTGLRHLKEILAARVRHLTEMETGIDRMMRDALDENHLEERIFRLRGRVRESFQAKMIAILEDPAQSEQQRLFAGHVLQRHFSGHPDFPDWNQDVALWNSRLWEVVARHYGSEV